MSVVYGLFRNSSTAAYYEVKGVRGDFEDSGFGLVEARDELRGVSAVAGEFFIVISLLRGHGIIIYVMRM